jgi:transcriptional regulator with XRE-family HTH domain
MFGFYLQQMRRNRGITSTQLAERAGLSRRSVSRWENCSALPRIPELMQLLEAIGADAEERAHCLALIPAPHAHRQVRNSQSEDAPGSWEALWGLRLRSGFTLKQTSERVGIGLTSISRWERGEGWPSAEKLQILCTALGASAEEYAAIQSARFSTRLNLTHGIQGDAVECYAARCHVLYLSERESTGINLYNLRALALTAEGMQLLPAHPGVLPVICKLLRGHSRHLSLSGMHPAANKACRRLLKLTEGQTGLVTDNVSARAVIARGLVRGAEWLPGQVYCPAPRPSAAAVQTAIRIVAPLLSAPVDSDMLAWLHSIVGLMYGLAGKQQEAMALLGKGVEIAERANLAAVELRRVDYAGLMLYLNRPETALVAADNAQSRYECPHNHMYTSFIKAAAFASVGDTGSSLKVLEPLEAMSDTYGALAIRSAAADLRTNLTA